MKNNKTVILMSLIGCLAILPQTASAEVVQSLRGGLEITAPPQVPEVDKLIPDQKPIKRDFVHQPPLIPHNIEGYIIDKNYNKCLSCHSWANAKAAGATKISQDHFIDRNDKKLTTLAPRRYFCTQCHVVQTDAPPLVDNTFQPAPPPPPQK